MGRTRGMRHTDSSPEGVRQLKHFCKKISPDNLEDKKLRMPNAFLNEFGVELSDFAKVVDPSGQTWEIGLTKSEKQVWFDVGWHEFVKHYSISSGYILLFGYRGSSNFSVLICDMHDFEIEYPDTSSERAEGPNNCEKCSTDSGNGVAEDDGNAEMLGSSYLHALSRKYLKGKTSNVESSKRGNAAEQNQETNDHRATVSSLKIQKFEHHRNMGKKRMIEEQVEEGTYKACNLKREKFDEERISWTRTPSVVNEMKDGENELLPKSEGFEEVIHIFTSGFRNASRKSEKAIYNARKFKTKNPSFIVVLRPYNLSHSLVYFPGEFSKKYVSDVPAYIKLWVSDGREWIARICRMRRSLAIGSGWRCFFRENNLDEGDVLVFEWIKKEVTMKISIFRAVQDDKTDDSSARTDDALLV